MEALILGGESPRHKEWVRQVAAALRPHMETVIFLDYRHWQANKGGANIDYEMNQAAELARELHDYEIVAKSIGTAITSLAVSRGLLTPQRCVFLGFPLAAVQAELPQVGDALQALPPTTFVQNEADPLGSAADVREYVAAHTPRDYNFRTLSGATHDYTDFQLITNLATSQ